MHCFWASTSFYSRNGQQFQGAVQGNGRAQSLWLIISLLLIRYLHQQKVVTAITAPMSKMCYFLATLVCVDDACLYMFNDGFMSVLKVVIKAQRLLNA